MKIRLDQVLDQHCRPTAVQVYRLSNMLDFYARVISKIMGVKGSLPKAFTE